MMSVTCSGSRLSPMTVESTTSANSTVTNLRSPSSERGALTSGLPQLLQNLAASGLRYPQIGHFIRWSPCALFHKNELSNRAVSLVYEQRIIASIALV